MTGTANGANILLLSCELAGGDWNVIMKILHEVFDNSPITLNIYYLREEDFKNYSGR